MTTESYNFLDDIEQLSAPGSAGVLSTSADKPYYEGRRSVVGDVFSSLGQGTVEATNQVGSAAKAWGIENDLDKWNPNIDYLKPDYGDVLGEKGVLRSEFNNVVKFAPTLGAMAGITSLTGGSDIPALAILLSITGSADYNNFSEKLKKERPDLSNDAIQTAALEHAAITTVPMAVAGSVMSGIAAPLKGLTSESIIPAVKNLLKMSPEVAAKAIPSIGENVLGGIGVKSILSDVGHSAATMAGMSTTTNVGNALLEQNLGMKDAPTTVDALKSGFAATVNGAIFGVAMRGISAVRQKAFMSTLNDYKNPQGQVDAIHQINSVLEEQDPELAAGWRKLSVDRLKTGQPFTINEEIFKLANPLNPSTDITPADILNDTTTTDEYVKSIVQDTSTLANPPLNANPNRISRRELLYSKDEPYIGRPLGEKPTEKPIVVDNRNVGTRQTTKESIYSNPEASVDTLTPDEKTVLRYSVPEPELEKRIREDINTVPEKELAQKFTPEEIKLLREKRYSEVFAPTLEDYTKLHEEAYQRDLTETAQRESTYTPDDRKNIVSISERLKYVKPETSLEEAVSLKPTVARDILSGSKDKLKELDSKESARVEDLARNTIASEYDNSNPVLANTLRADIPAILSEVQQHGDRELQIRQINKAREEAKLISSNNTDYIDSISDTAIDTLKSKPAVDKVNAGIKSDKLAENLWSVKDKQTGKEYSIFQKNNYGRKSTNKEYEVREKGSEEVIASAKTMKEAKSELSKALIGTDRWSTPESGVRQYGDIIYRKVGDKIIGTDSTGKETYNKKGSFLSVQKELYPHTITSEKSNFNEVKFNPKAHEDKVRTEVDAYEKKMGVETLKKKEKPSPLNSDVVVTDAQGNKKVIPTSTEKVVEPTITPVKEVVEKPKAITRKASDKSKALEDQAAKIKRLEEDNANIQKRLQEQEKATSLKDEIASTFSQEHNISELDKGSQSRYNPSELNLDEKNAGSIYDYQESKNSAVDDSTSSTIDKTRSNLDKIIGNRDALEKSGKLVISDEKPPTGTQATYNPKTDVITLYPKNIKAGREFNVLAHERFHEGHGKVFEDKVYKALGERFSSLREKNKAIAEAFDKAETNNPGKDAAYVQEEAIAYFLEDKINQKTSIGQSILSWVKQKMIKYFGVKVVNHLTPEDLIDIFRRETKNISETPVPKEQALGFTKDSGDILESKATKDYTPDEYEKKQREAIIKGDYTKSVEKPTVAETIRSYAPKLEQTLVNYGQTVHATIENNLGKEAAQNLMTHEHNIDFFSKEYHDQIQEWVNKVEKMTPEDKVLYKSVMLNYNDPVNKAISNTLHEKYDIDFFEVSKVLESIKDRAIETGVNIKELEHYFPRIVIDAVGLEQYIKGSETNREFRSLKGRDPEVQKAFDEAIKEVGDKDVQAFTEKAREIYLSNESNRSTDIGQKLSIDVERWSLIEAEIEDARLEAAKRGLVFDRRDIITRILNTGRFYNVRSLKKMQSSKDRSIDNVSLGMMKYYADPIQSMLSHIMQSNETIEMRAFAGNSNLKDLNKELSSNIKAFDEAKSQGIGGEVLSSIKNRIYELEALVNDKETLLNEGIAKIIGDKVHTLSKEDLATVQNAIRARLTQKGMSGVAADFRNVVLATTMASGFAPITQLGDFAKTLYIYGGKGTYGGVFGDQMIKMSDFNWEHPLREFTQGGGSARFADKVLKMTGLTMMDAFGKTAAMNAEMNKIKAMTLEDFHKEYGHFWNGNTERQAAAYEDIKNGVVSKDVREIAFTAINRLQPASLSQMTAAQLGGGNLRMMYMLKSFAIHQLNFIYQETRNDFLNGNKAKGMLKLVALTSVLALGGATTDQMKDFLLGRDHSFSDSFYDNILKLGFLSKYSLDSGLRNGIGTEFAKNVLPPLGIPNALGKDLFALSKGTPTHNFLTLVPGGQLLQSLTKEGKTKQAISGNRLAKQAIYDEAAGKISTDEMKSIVGDYNTSVSRDKQFSYARIKSMRASIKRREKKALIEENA